MKYKYCKPIAKALSSVYINITQTVNIISKYKHGTTINYKMCYSLQLIQILKNPTLSP